MKRTLAMAVALAALALPAAAQEPDAVQKYMTEHRAQIEASGELLMWLGACEAHIPPKTVNFYLKEYGTTDAGAEDFVSTGLAAFHMRQYVKGKAEAANLGLSADSCRKMVAEVIEELRVAMKAKP